jgi:hypothetical protein
MREAIGEKSALIHVICGPLLIARCPKKAYTISPTLWYTYSMTTTQKTAKVPASRRVYSEVPRETPAGKTKAAIMPVSEAKTPQPMTEERTWRTTPHTDWLCGLLFPADDISLDELRAERLGKYLK